MAARVLGLGGSIVLARLLTPRDFGMAAIGFTIVTFGSFLANGGFAAALLRQKDVPSREDLGAVLGFQIVLAVAFAGGVAAIAAPLGTTGELVAIMTLTLPIDVLRIPAAILAERELRYRPIVMTQLVEVAAYYVWAVSAAALGMGVWSIATGAVVRAVIGSATLAVMVRAGIVRPSLSFSRVRRLFGFGVRFQAVGAVNLLRDQGLNLAVAAIAGVTALGLWTIAFRAVQSTTLIFESLWRVLFPAMARFLETGEDARPLLERGVALTATVAGFLVIAVGGPAPVLVPTMFGEQWADAAAILPWAAVGVALAGPLSACVAGYLYAVGDATTALRAALIHTAVWFATALPILPVIGVEALGIGWLVACVADFAVFASAVNRRTGMPVLRILYRPLAATVLGVVGALLVASGLPPNLLSLAVSLTVGEALYTVTIWSTYRKPLVELIGVMNRALRPAKASS